MLDVVLVQCNGLAVVSTAGRPNRDGSLAGSSRDRRRLGGNPVAPLRRHDRSLEKATKNRGRPFWASSDEHVVCEAGSPCSSPGVIPP